VQRQVWPQYDPAAAAEEMITLVVQINGKVRDRLEVPADIGEEDAKAKALSSDSACRFPFILCYDEGDLCFAALDNSSRRRYTC
jgi:leucyl-tRNA synthetase